MGMKRVEEQAADGFRVLKHHKEKLELKNATSTKSSKSKVQKPTKPQKTAPVAAAQTSAKKVAPAVDTMTAEHLEVLASQAVAKAFKIHQQRVKVVGSAAASQRAATKQMKKETE